jgi:hypothetical protein
MNDHLNDLFLGFYPINAFSLFFPTVFTDKSVSVFLSIVTFSTYYSTTYDGNDIITQSGSS